VRVAEGRAIRFGVDEWTSLSGAERRAFDVWLARLTGRRPSAPPRVAEIVYFGAGRYRLRVEVVESAEARALRGAILFEEVDELVMIEPIFPARWEAVTVSPVAELVVPIDRADEASS